MCCSFFFFNDTATTEIYTLSLHDALPISARQHRSGNQRLQFVGYRRCGSQEQHLLERQCEQLALGARSEEHTSELQSRQYLVCRLLLEKKKTTHYAMQQHTTTGMEPIHHE